MYLSHWTLLAFLKPPIAALASQTSGTFPKCLFKSLQPFILSIFSSHSYTSSTSRNFILSLLIKHKAHSPFSYSYIFMYYIPLNLHIHLGRIIFFSVTSLITDNLVSQDCFIFRYQVKTGRFYHRALTSTQMQRCWGTTWERLSSLRLQIEYRSKIWGWG